MSTLSANRFVPLGVLILALFFISTISRNAGAQQTAPQVSFPTAIEWKPQAGVRIWRLQVAADEKFQDIFLDRRVLGGRYLVSEIPAGSYFWRVAPVEAQSYSNPVRFFISGGVVTAVDIPPRPQRAKPQRARRGQ